MRRAMIAMAALMVAGCGIPRLSRDAGSRAYAPGPAAEQTGEGLRITAIDVGQGDSILIEAPSGEAVLVDAGPAGAGRFSVLPLLAERGIERLSAVIVTHRHSDHYGGLGEIAAGPDGAAGTGDDFAIEVIYGRSKQDCPEAHPPSDDGALAPCPGQTLSAGDRIELGDLSLEVVAANAALADKTAVDAGDPPDENAMSVALLLEYSGFRMLLAADITGGGGNPPYQTPDVETPLGAIVGDIDILKVAHHGSATSSNRAFLDATSPEVAIISVGDGNDYGHPH
ncbi:MAG: MBL fold metallo-hydrolase, partial [Proteobacteria bacterium]|nr:MBL fold metallo-hydrolase [Pseudomonadota bacterium]